MTLVEDARRLRDEAVIAAGNDEIICGSCGAELAAGPHDDDCHVVLMGKIVAALEAAERIKVAHERGVYAEDMEGDIAALAVAMKGEV